MNGVANDPGWGLWFTYGNDNGAAGATTRPTSRRPALTVSAITRLLVTPYAPIVEFKWNPSLQRWNTAARILGLAELQWGRHRLGGRVDLV